MGGPRNPSGTSASDAPTRGRLGGHGDTPPRALPLGQTGGVARVIIGHNYALFILHPRPPPARPLNPLPPPDLAMPPAIFSVLSFQAIVSIFVPLSLFLFLFPFFFFFPCSGFLKPGSTWSCPLFSLSFMSHSVSSDSLDCFIYSVYLWVFLLSLFFFLLFCLSARHPGSLTLSPKAGPTGFPGGIHSTGLESECLVLHFDPACWLNCT